MQSTGDGRETEKKPLLGELAQGFRKRTWVTTRLATKLGRRAVRALRGKESKPVDEAQAEQAAQKLVEQLSGLKGLVMKVGQIASYMPGALPPVAQRVMAQLQADSNPMTWEAVSAVLADELGGDPHEAFDAIEETAFAAASIGQVHRARYRGRNVAVKVQYPGIEDLLRSDLKTMGLFARLSAVGTSVDGKALVRELRDRMLEECDYHREAANQRLFASLYNGDDALVPGVVDELTTRRVITTELIEAAGFYDFCESAAPEVRNRAAQTIFRFSFDSIYRHCLYNADPHPGNYLFFPDGRVALLDFGCVRAFPEDLINTWRRTALALVDEDKAAFIRHFPELGMVASPKKFDWDAQWEIMRYLYKPFIDRAPYFTYTHEYVQQSYDLLLFKNPNRRYTAQPPEFLFLNRLQWGLNSVLAYLGAVGPWPELFRAALESPSEPIRLPAAA